MVESNWVHRHGGISQTTKIFSAVVLLNIVVFFVSTVTVSKCSVDMTALQETMEAFQTTSAERKGEMNVAEKGLRSIEFPSNSLAEEKTESISLSTKTVESHRVTTPPTRKWAYAFLVGSAGPTETSDYFSGMSSVMAVSHELRKLGSVADFVIMVQMSAHSPLTKLPDYEEELLRKMNIRIAYVPKFANEDLEGFYALMNEKFRILEMEEYSRVMYLDYDVFPFCNLDYLFELSEPLPESANVTKPPFQLKENVILGYKEEPSAGGIFVLKPSISDFDHLQQIVHEKEIRSFHQPYPHWDESYGWGHVITPPDYWKILRGWKKQNWTWYGSWADQGLLYYWTKYVKKSVSIIIRNDVEQWDKENWIETWDGKLILRNETFDFEKNEIKGVLKNPFMKNGYGCPQQHLLPNPYDDFKHMTGVGKPWYKSREELENPPDCLKANSKMECKAQVEWYNSLKEALASINHLDDYPWDRAMHRKKNEYGVQAKTMGNSPNFGAVRQYLQALHKNKWKMYAEDTHKRISISAVQ